jgi:single-strand DNA-binding protein
MIVATVAGNIGKDAETRQAGKDTVTSFSVASTEKSGDKKTTTWVDCSIWGKRGSALAQYLTKGSSVSVVGGLSTHEHNGKTYLKLRVDHIDLLGGKGGGGAKQETPAPSSSLPADDDDQIPF